jgi:hypothetical protein
MRPAFRDDDADARFRVGSHGGARIRAGGVEPDSGSLSEERSSPCFGPSGETVMNAPAASAQKGRVFIGVPSYDDRINSAILNALFFASRTEPKSDLVAIVESGSWLTRNFNSLYAAALNMREEKNLTHFCLLHDDIAINEPWWLDKMLDLMEEKGADILSAIVPIKNGTGLTSTAFDELIGDPPHVRRLTLHEAFTNFPPTFTQDKLLLNTGLMLVDIRKVWAEMLFFEFEDRILKIPNGDKTTFRAVGCPEDWNFSRKARSLGAKLFATREIKVTHVGTGRFSNHMPAGSMKEDR